MPRCSSRFKVYLANHRAGPCGGLRRARHGTEIVEGESKVLQKGGISRPVNWARTVYTYPSQVYFFFLQGLGVTSEPRDGGSTASPEAADEGLKKTTN
jgi:hypothetical protein